jgi:hypothetical protein
MALKAHSMAATFGQYMTSNGLDRSSTTLSALRGRQYTTCNNIQLNKISHHSVVPQPALGTSGTKAALIVIDNYDNHNRDGDDSDDEELPTIEEIIAEMEQKKKGSVAGPIHDPKPNGQVASMDSEPRVLHGASVCDAPHCILSHQSIRHLVIE